MNDINVLITGVNGFVGKYLSKLITEKYNRASVFGFDICGKSVKDKVFIVDIGKEDEVLPILDKLKPSYIFHLAGTIYSNNWDELFQNNVNKTKCLIDMIMKSKILSRIIIPGSAAEYGSIPTKYLPVIETQVPNPVTLYGLSKVFQTNIAKYYAAKGMDIVIGRLFNFIGKGASERLAIGAFAQQLMKINKFKSKRNIIRVGNIDSKRDFLDIEDICSGLIAIAQKGKRGEIYNICSGSSISMKNILKMMIDRNHQKIKVLVDHNRIKKNDIKNIYGSNQKIQSETGWYSQVSITKSIDKLFDLSKNCNFYN